MKFVLTLMLFVSANANKQNEICDKLTFNDVSNYACSHQQDKHINMNTLERLSDGLAIVLSHLGWKNIAIWSTMDLRATSAIMKKVSSLGTATSIVACLNQTKINEASLERLVLLNGNGKILNFLFTFTSLKPDSILLIHTRKWDLSYIDS